MTTPIPRPPTARPGDPPPWTRLTTEARRRLGLARVLDALVAAGRAGSPGGPVAADPAPGTRSIAPGGAPAPASATTPGVAPVAPGAATASADDPSSGPGAGGLRSDAAEGFPFRFRAPSPPASSAAVLVPMFEEAGETRVVLTRRAATLRSHRGEVSFPGGRAEPGESMVAAALREAEEEIGLAPRAVRPVGWLEPLSTVSSGAWITPVVGVLEGRPATAPNPDEVARVFDVALADLLADGVYHEERWVVPGREVAGSPDGSFPVYFYEVATEIVWGATGRMLTDLLAVVTGTQR